MATKKLFIKLSGGLGNQILQNVAALSFAKKYNVDYIHPVYSDYKPSIKKLIRKVRGISSFRPNSWLPLHANKELGSQMIQEKTNWSLHSMSRYLKARGNF